MADGETYVLGLAADAAALTPSTPFCDALTCDEVFGVVSPASRGNLWGVTPIYDTSPIRRKGSGSPTTTTLDGAMRMAT